MKTKLYILILLAFTLPGSGFAQASKPLAERQEEFLSWKFGMFICYGLASFNQGQWATGYEDSGTFAPTQLDCGQWADAAKAAGMKYAVFTTKHTSGYEYPWLKDRKRQPLPPEDNTNVAEVCDCITPGAWYWQPNLTEKSVTGTAEVVDMLKLCNSRQANYLLNVPPDRTGRIPEWLVRRLEEIGQEWQEAKPSKPEPK